MRLILLSGVLAAGFFACPAIAEDCPGNPGAVGTSRTIVVDPAKMQRIGSMSYPQTLPLEPKEVVLTFDDGPQPKYTVQVLETLAHECVKATFFIIGSLAKEYPDWVQRVAREGHSIGNHSETHPRYIDHLPVDRGIAEIDTATRHIEDALAPAGFKMAPFFRFPGFRHTEALDQHANKQGFVVIGADFPADDWTFIGPEMVMKRALDRLERRGSGILLLHDIHQRTATILPKLLHELKARGYKIVQMVPPANAQEPVASAPETPTVPAEAATKTPGANEPAPKQTAAKEAPKEASSKAAPTPALEAATKTPGTNEPAPKQAAAKEAPKEASSKAAPTPAVEAAAKAPGTNEPAPKQAAAKDAPKETPSTAAASIQQAAAAAVAAPSPSHRHTASLRRYRHATRQAAVKTYSRSLRDSPD